MSEVNTGYGEIPKEFLLTEEEEAAAYHAMALAGLRHMLSDRYAKVEELPCGGPHR